MPRDGSDALSIRSVSRSATSSNPSDASSPDRVAGTGVELGGARRFLGCHTPIFALDNLAAGLEDRLRDAKRLALLGLSVAAVRCCLS